MNLTKTALKRPVSCVLIIISLFVFGITSLFGFKLQLTPDMEMPMLIVLTIYPGADPESVDELVTNVVEDAGSILSGVDSYYSYSMENYSMVLFQYEYGSDIDDCYADLRAALDTASLSLPEDAKTPTAVEMNMNSMPCTVISAVEKGDIDLYKVIEDSVKPELEKISGVAEVATSGGTEEYIKVELNETLMKQYGLTMSTLAQSLSACDFSYPAGSVKQGSQDVSVITSMTNNTAQLLKSVPITTSTGKVITLEEVADVYSAVGEESGVSRYNGHDNVSISITNKSSYGTVNVCDSIKKALTKIQEDNPAIEFEISYDASEGILSSLKSVGETLILGIVLSMVVLFLFFGDFKASLIVGSSMPISLFLTLVLMKAAGFSMNVVTMGSLVIAIGMMVDSSIVVIESCFRLKEKKEDFKEAALEGTRVVTASIVASTITTIVVYLPLATMKGLSGQMFSQLGFTIVFAMLASLISALTLVPLFYTFFKPKEKTEIPVNRIIRWITRGYRKVLRKLLNKRKLVILVSVLLVVVSIFLGSSLDMELMSAADEGMVSVDASFRPGTTLETMNKEMLKWEQIAAADEDVESYSLSIGGGGMNAMMGGGDASLSATLKKDRSMSTDEKVDQWNEIAATMPGVDITVSSSGSNSSSMMSSSSYEIDLQGDDLEALEDFSMELEDKVKQIDGVIKVNNSTASATTRAQIEVDPLKAMQYGLTPIQVGTTMNNVVSGMDAITVTNSGTEYKVKLEYPEGLYDNLNDLMNVEMSTPYGYSVPIHEIAEIQYEEAQSTLVKANGQYQVSLTAALQSEKKFDAQTAIDELVKNTEFPENVQPVDNAMNEMMMEELGAIGKAILIAVFLVFLVMAMQFESPRFSFMVMMCIPFAIIGSFSFLWLAQATISMVSMMGFLMLMGIVVNNGILYVDSANQLREEMSVEDALIETGAIRLRPILMTSLTTILAMIPMGIGFGTNAEMMQGMALVIIGGMIASTLLTLILLPTIYLIIDKREGKRRRTERKERRKAFFAKFKKAKV